MNPLGESERSIATGTPVPFSPRRAISTITAPESYVPLPLREFIVKVYERCNLACDYCYMYEMADQTWKEKPTSMTKAVFSQLSFRIGEHVREHCLKEIDVVFHGGEPLLRGVEFFEFAVSRLYADLPSGVTVKFRLQTNGILLTESILNAFLKLNIHIGVSLDGGREQHDRHRKYRNGKLSYDEVAQGVSYLTQAKYRQLFSRLYCTVDIDNDPIETYDSLAMFEPPAIDFLLPHGNWDSPPPQLNSQSTDTLYADWLIEIFNRWYHANSDQPPIRLFTEIINLLLDGHSRVESIGLSPSALVVIETDGTIEQTDALRSAFHGATHTGFNVADNTFNDVLGHPSIIFRQIGTAALCQACQACRVRDVCGAGYMPHRYSLANGFQNPSIYCKDLMHLIDHIKESLQTSIDAAYKAM